MGDFDQSLSLRYYPIDREAGFILLCTVQPRSDLPPRTSPPSKLDSEPFEVPCTG